MRGRCLFEDGDLGVFSVGSVSVRYGSFCASS